MRRAPHKESPVLDPGKRRASLILIAAAVLLLLSIAIGKRMGDRVITKATEQGQSGVGSSISYSPARQATEPGAMGPNWKRTQVLAFAPDPGFPDPRVPPVPLPTPIPTPRPTERPAATPRPAPTPTSDITPQPQATSPYLLHGPSITPAPLSSTSQPVGTAKPPPKGGKATPGSKPEETPVPGPVPPPPE